MPKERDPEPVAEQVCQPEGSAKSSDVGGKAKKQAKPSRKENATPSKSIGKSESERSAKDIYRMIGEVMGGDELTLYFVPPVKLWRITLPAVVQDQPLPDMWPVYYQYVYRLMPEKVDGFYQPHVHVTRNTMNCGVVAETYEFYMEHEFVEKCMSFSPCRDYQTLISQIFPICHRGMTGKLTTIDLNSKCDAMAALYLHRVPNFIRVVASNATGKYRPSVSGWYALGSHDAPMTGDLQVRMRFKTDRDPVVQHYVARLLDDRMHGIIHPSFIPARDRVELQKAAAKRLSRPSRNFDWVNAIHGNATMGLGQGMDREESRKTVRMCVKHFLDWFDKKGPVVEPLGPREILEACERHAKEKFGAQQDVDKYMEGANIALFESTTSELFKKCVADATKVSHFIKDEPYPEPKPARFIMAPSLRVRGFCHALLYNAQRRLFGTSAQNKLKFCVKHMNEDERKQYVRNLFGARPVFNTDYSSMEGSIGPDHMADIEREIFCHLAIPSEAGKLKILWDAYIHNDYVAENKFERIELQPMRLSGQEHTSSGNFLCNLIWLSYIVYYSSGHLPDYDRWLLLCEGDDGLSTQEVPLDNGKNFNLDPDLVTHLAETLGARMKLKYCKTVDEASFCGIKLKPAKVNDEDQDVLDLDDAWILSKIYWSIGYDRTSRKHDSLLLYARALSYLVRAKGNDELYRAVWWTAQENHPKGHQITGSVFRHIWVKVFYKGEAETMPDYEDAPLEKFAKKFNCPNLGHIDRPKLLSQEIPTELCLPEVFVEPVDGYGVTDLVHRVAGRGIDGYEIEDSSNFLNNDCMYHAVYNYLHETDQVQGDYETWRSNHHATATTFNFVHELLEDGQHIVVLKSAIGQIVRVSKENNQRTNEHLGELPDYVIVLDLQKGHAYNIRKRHPRDPDDVPVGKISMILPVILILFVIYVLWRFYYLFFKLSDPVFIGISWLRFTASEPAAWGHKYVEPLFKYPGVSRFCRMYFLSAIFPFSFVIGLLIALVLTVVFSVVLTRTNVDPGTLIMKGLENVFSGLFDGMSLLITKLPIGVSGWLMRGLLVCFGALITLLCFF